jgi:hypothetical protein
MMPQDDNKQLLTTDPRTTPKVPVYYQYVPQKWGILAAMVGETLL